MGGIGNYLEDLILKHALTSSTAAFVTTTTVYLSLHTADPGETGANEFSSYVRPEVHIATGANSTYSNDTTHSVVVNSTGTITYVGLWDASATGTGNFFWGGALSASKTVANSGDTVTLAIGALTITLD